MAPKKEKPYPEILASMADMIGQSLMEECKMPQEKATELSVNVTEMFRKSFGGEPIYLPRFVQCELSQRDREILDKCKWQNYDEVAKEYGISTRRIYQIILNARFADQGTQPFLPFESNNGEV